MRAVVPPRRVLAWRGVCSGRTRELAHYTQVRLHPTGVCHTHQALVHGENLGSGLQSQAQITTTMTQGKPVLGKPVLKGRNSWYVISKVFS